MNSFEAKRGFFTFIVLNLLAGGIFFAGREVFNLLKTKKEAGAPKTQEILTIDILDSKYLENTIEWKSDKPYVGSVTYSLDPDVCQKTKQNCETANENTETTNHSVKLINLIPKTKYYFYINQENNKSAITSFETENKPSDTEANQEPSVIPTIEDINNDGVINAIDLNIIFFNPQSPQ